MSRPPKYDSKLPHSVVGVYEGLSAMYQFRGVAMETRAGRMAWYQEADGTLISNLVTLGRDGQPANGSYIIDRDQKMMTFTQRESSGAVATSRNVARPIESELEHWGRTPGDVEASFDELVTVALDSLAIESDTRAIDGPDVDRAADIDR